jgi:hypothetical protein
MKPTQEIKDNILKMNELVAVAKESKKLIKTFDTQISDLEKSKKRINDFARKESGLLNRQMDKVLQGKEPIAYALNQIEEEIVKLQKANAKLKQIQFRKK